MRLLLLTALATSIPWAAQAQRRVASVSNDTTLDAESMPPAIRREIEVRWSGPADIRSNEAVTIAAGTTISGSVAIQNGPLVIFGHVTGNVTAVNCDVSLRPNSRIDGDLWVIGGSVDGRDNTTIAGEIRVYRGRISASRNGDRLMLDGDMPPRTRRFLPRPEGQSWSDPIHIATAGAYNRVEGLPIDIGPEIYQATSWGSMRLDAMAVVRTGSTFESGHGDVGDDVKMEMRLGHSSGPAIGGRLFNTIDPVEPWQLPDIETSLASFLFRRDYRDYYAQHGASAFARVYAGHDASLTASFADERWASRDRLNPFSVFRGDLPWRDNPAMDEGRLHVGNLTLRYDSRTDSDDPHSGLYVVIDGEHGAGRLSTVAPTSIPRAYGPGDAIAYNRGFIDARSYSRLSPVGQLSFRVVAGGWISGDELPLERRLSVEGPALLPGYDFREVSGSFDTGTCSVGVVAGRPAECDRIAVAQVEYRGNLHIDIGDWREDAGRFIGARTDGSWVMFVDAGRGWMVGPASGDVTYSRDILPPTQTFRTDAGVGFDFGGVGIYAAKGLSAPFEAVNFFLLLHRRF